MLSRVADSLYWMSRYLERTDSIMRMLKTNYAYSQEVNDGFTWRPVLTIFTYLDGEQITGMEKDSAAVLEYMVFDRDNANSVFNMITRARENARSVQDHITLEMWQCINDFYHYIKHTREYSRQLANDPATTLDAFIKQSMTYYGISESTMFRGEGFSFMNMGRYLERAMQSTDLLDVKFSDLSYDMEKTVDVAYWKHLLLSLSGYNLYLKTYRSGFDARNVIDQVIFNTNFPRSVLYSLNQLQRYFDRLKGDVDAVSHKDINFMIGKVRSKIQYSNLESVSEIGLHRYLVDVNEDLQEIGTALSRYYFAYN